MGKRILIACEKSQVVCLAFRALGHEAFSCDLLPCEGGHPEWHIQDDALNHLDEDWSLLIGHPECTFLTVSANKWLKDQPPRKSGALVGQARRDARTEAILFFWKLAYANIPRIAIENPIGIMSTMYRKPDQIIQPYQFGHDASKSTCLWLKNLPLLVGTDYIEPRITAQGRKRWANQCEIGAQDSLPPSKDRSALRSRTYEGIAKAMANQWGLLL